MTRPTANLRLFVAIYPPDDCRRALLHATELIPLAPARMTPAAQVHLTLQFVGDVPARELDSVIESVERSAAGLDAFSLIPRRLVTLPLKARPRLVAAETDSPPTLLELQRRLSHRLASKVRPSPSDRFLPHITLCRFNPSVRADTVDHPVNMPGFAVLEVVLMRSTLSPSGATHHAVCRVALGPAGGFAT